MFRERQFHNNQSVNYRLEDLPNYINASYENKSIDQIDSVSHYLSCEKLRVDGVRHPRVQQALEVYIRTYGWRDLLDDLYNDPALGIDILQFCIRNYSSYAYLTDEDLEGMLTNAKLDAFTYSLLKDVSEFRQSMSQRIVELDPNILTVILDEHEVEYRNIEALDRYTSLAFKKYPDLRQWAVTAQQNWINQNGDTPSSRDPHGLSDEQVIEKIFVAYKADVVTKYVQRENVESDKSVEATDFLNGVFAEIYPAAIDLVKLVDTAAKSNTGVYNEVAIFCNDQPREFITSPSDVAAVVFPALAEVAREIFPDNTEMQLMYITNSKVVSIAKDVHLVTSPDGEFVDIIGTGEHTKKYLPKTEIPINIAVHLMSIIYQQDIVSMDGVAAALYGNWASFPKEIQEKASALGIEPYDGFGSLSDSRMLYDMAKQSGVVNHLTRELAQEILELLERNINENYFSVDPLSFINTSDIIEHFSQSISGQALRKVDLGRIVTLLSPSLILNLEKHLGVSFSELTSLREFLALCGFLSTFETKNPFEIIENIMHGADSPEQKMKRLKAFLIDRFDGNAIENFTIFAHMIEPETANRAFDAYAKAIDSVHRFQVNVETSTVEASQASEISQLIQHLDIGLIRRAGHLFEAGKQMSMWEYMAEEGIPDLINSFEGVAKMCELLSSLGGTSSSELVSSSQEKGGDSSMKIFKSSFVDKSTGYIYQLKTSIRSVASEQGEARINFELSLNNLPKDNELYKAFYQTTKFKGGNGKNARTVSGSVIRFGFDLDTSTNPPVFSFDMGRDAYVGENMERTGDVLGRILSQVAPTGHHLQDFDPSLSDPENFKKIAERFISYFEQIKTTVVVAQ